MPLQLKGVWFSTFSSCATHSALSRNRNSPGDKQQYESNIDIIYSGNDDNRRPFVDKRRRKHKRPMESEDSVSASNIQGAGSRQEMQDGHDGGGSLPSNENDEMFNEELLNVQANEPDFLRGLQARVFFMQSASSTCS